MLSVFIIVVYADSAIQTDWSGGDGVQGPVWEWDSTFSQSCSLNHVTNGYLQLGIIPNLVEHIPLIDINVGSEPLWGDIDLDGDVDLLEVTVGDSIYWHEHPSNPEPWPKHFVDSFSEVISIDFISFKTATPMFVVNYDDGGVSTVERFLYWGGSWGSGYVGELGESQYNTGVTSGDIDGNGTQDIVGWKWAWDEIVVWWGGSPDSMEVLLTPHTPSDVFVFDGDWDGDSELAVDKSWYPETVVFWNTSGGWVGSTLPNLFYAYGIDNGDINGDGICELTAISYSDQFLFWMDGYSWEGDLLANGPDRCAFIDLDDDSDTDVVGFGSSTFHFFYNCDQSGNLFGAVANVGFFGSRLECADMNLDGREDLILTNTNTGQVRWYEHYVGYESEGSLESSILYLGSDPGWDSINWTGDVPAGTSVAFLVRASDDPDSMGTWSDTLYSSCSLSGVLEENDSYFQYKVILATTDPDSTPTLLDVTVTWDPVSVEDSSEPILPGIALLPIAPNPVVGSPVIRFGLPEPASVEIAIFDLSGRLVSKTHGGEYTPGYHDVLLDDLSPGIYFCKMISGDFTATQRFVVIE